HPRAELLIAWDETHIHPTPALLFAFTILQHKGRDFRQLSVTICGDILHSRVARSNVLLLKLLGARVRLAGPRTLLPPEFAELGCHCFHRLEPALEGADVVMMLRIQNERLGGAFFPGVMEYARFFSLNRDRPEIGRAHV